MDGQPAGPQPTVGPDGVVPDPAALSAHGRDSGEPPPVRDPAAPPPPPTAADEAKGPTEALDSGTLHAPQEPQTSVPEASEVTTAPRSEVVIDETPVSQEVSGEGAVRPDSDTAEKEAFLVPTVSVDGPIATPESPAPDIADGPIDLAPRSAPPPGSSRPEPPQGRERASSAAGGFSSPRRPSACPGFRPYSETPVYSDNGAPESPPPPEPPPDLPRSGDWHRKTIDDLIAMDIPDVRIPRCVGTWGACEIRGWLRGLGLEQYVDALLSNGICGRRLCLLTASNLPRMGVTDWRHIRAITGSVRGLLSIADCVPYDQQYERPPPGPMTRALYLQCARPTGPPPPSSERYREFLRQHGFLDVLLELTNRPVVTLPQPQPGALYREIAVPPVPTPSPSRGGSPASGSPY